MKLHHEFNIRTLELKSIREEQQRYSEMAREDEVERIRRRKDFAGLKELVYIESIVDNLELAVNDTIKTFCRIILF